MICFFYNNICFQFALIHRTRNVFGTFLKLFNNLTNLHSGLLSTLS
ncbi:Uncharacterised protein [Vibrio cholerae]|nr:Uncharacterised protein [Vibrio cholerae]